MAQAAVRRTHAMRVVHQMPGRLRVRLGPGQAGGEAADAVSRLPGVRAASWSTQTRGLLVVYDPAATTGAAVLGAVWDHVDAGADVVPPEAAPAIDRASSLDRVPTLASAVADAFGEVDRRVRSATRGTIGLGGLLPLALTLWAVREMVAGRFAPLGWSSALWYAHGLFRDYNTPSP